MRAVQFKSALTIFFVGLVGGALVSALPMQSGLEDGKRAYFEGRFEDSVRILEPQLQSLSEPTERQEAAFFLGLNQRALGNEDQASQYFQSSVRHDPSFSPGADVFSPDIVSAYAAIKSSMVGRLSVESSPSGAEVVVSGVTVGTTPFQGEALEGEQLVRVLLDGYHEEERTVNVRLGEDTSVSVELASGRSAAGAGAGAQVSDSSGGGGNGKTIGILAGVGGGAAVLALAAGGGDDEGPTGGAVTPTPASRGSFSASIAPSTVTAESSTDSAFQFLARFTVTIVESAGLGGNVDFVNVTLTSTAGSSTSAVNFGAGDVIGRAGSNRVEARSRLQVPVGVVYTFSTRRSSGNITVEIQVTDDRGNRSRITATASLL